MEQVRQSVNFTSYAGFMVVACAALTVAVSICRSTVKPTGSAGPAGISGSQASLVAASGPQTPHVDHLAKAGLATITESKMAEVEPQIHQTASNDASSKDSVELPQQLPVSKRSASHPPVEASSDSMSKIAMQESHSASRPPAEATSDSMSKVAVEVPRQLGSSKHSAANPPAGASSDSQTRTAVGLPQQLSSSSESATVLPATASSGSKTKESIEEIARDAAAGMGTHIPEEAVHAAIVRVRARLEKERNEEAVANAETVAALQGESAIANEILRDALHSDTKKNKAKNNSTILTSYLKEEKHMLHMAMKAVGKAEKEERKAEKKMQWAREILHDALDDVSPNGAKDLHLKPVAQLESGSEGDDESTDADDRDAQSGSKGDDESAEADDKEDVMAKLQSGNQGAIKSAEADDGDSQRELVAEQQSGSKGDNESTEAYATDSTGADFQNLQRRLDVESAAADADSQKKLFAKLQSGSKGGSKGDDKLKAAGDEDLQRKSVAELQSGNKVENKSEVFYDKHLPQKPMVELQFGVKRDNEPAASHGGDLQLEPTAKRQLRTTHMDGKPAAAEVAAAAPAKLESETKHSHNEPKAAPLVGTRASDHSHGEVKKTVAELRKQKEDDYRAFLRKELYSA